LLGDAPADGTGRRLAAAILKASLPTLLGGAAASVASAVVISQGLADSGAAANPAAVAGAAVLPLALALAPLVAPLVEVARFAGMDAQRIEDAVRLKEPLQVRPVDSVLGTELWTPLPAVMATGSIACRLVAAPAGQRLPAGQRPQPRAAFDSITVRGGAPPPRRRPPPTRPS
jgi:hypothetical protein